MIFNMRLTLLYGVVHNYRITIMILYMNEISRYTLETVL